MINLLDKPLHEIRAYYDDEKIRVYQAYRPDIAKQAVKLGRFGSNFKMSRMTWIKPSFLWMMYRCGWGQKEGQEHILAIDVKRNFFDSVVKQAVISSYKDDLMISRQQWQETLRTSDVVCQWDPERDIYANPLIPRSLQLGIRNEMLRQYVYEATVQIEDITEYVKMLKEKIDNGVDVTEELPKEKLYIPTL